MVIILWKWFLDQVLDNLKIISKIVIRLQRRKFKKFNKIKTKYKIKIWNKCKIGHFFSKYIFNLKLWLNIIISKIYLFDIFNNRHGKDARRGGTAPEGGTRNMINTTAKININRNPYLALNT